MQGSVPVMKAERVESIANHTHCSVRHQEYFNSDSVVDQS